MINIGFLLFEVYTGKDFHCLSCDSVHVFALHYASSLVLVGQTAGDDGVDETVDIPVDAEPDDCSRDVVVVGWCTAG